MEPRLIIPSREQPVLQTSDALSGATIVFDLDGTLVETAPDILSTLNVLLEREGLAPFTLEKGRTLIGQGAKALVSRGFAAAGEPLDDAKLERLFQDFIVHYLDHIADESRPFDGVIAAMDVLEARGARLAVCTNKRTDLSLALLDALGLTGRFAAVVGGDGAPAPKPDARHLLTTIARAGGDPARAVMIGDSISDAMAARNAGVPLILVSFGYTDTPARDLGADILIDHFDELPAACARLLTAPASA